MNYPVQDVVISLKVRMLPVSVMQKALDTLLDELRKESEKLGYEFKFLEAEIEISPINIDD